MADQRHTDPLGDKTFLEAVYGSEAEGRKLQSRRRFVKVGLAATPVLMSVASRPVWGSGLCSLSGLMSGNASQHTHECTQGYGCTPGFWRNHPLVWPDPIVPGECSETGPSGKCQEWNADASTKFNEAFGCGPTKSMMWMLHQSEWSGTLEFHAIASLLNALKLPKIDFGADASEVINAYCDAKAGLIDADALHDTLDNMNNRGCPINAVGDCDDNFVVNEDGQCIPLSESEPDPSDP